MQTVLALVGIAIACFVLTVANGLRHNIAQAQRSRLPYVVTPCSPIFLPWQLTHKLWLPIIRLLPRSWYEERLDLLLPDVGYRTGHDRFAQYGDTFIVVSPAMLYVMTSSAEAIHQVTSRKDHFPKMTETYSILRQFGDNIVTCEGAPWRLHRKATSASFNEKNAALVFQESIRQAEGLLETRTAPEGEQDETIHTLEADTMRLALHIIGYAGFGLTLLWPGQDLPSGANPKLAKYASLKPSAGHKLSFVDTIAMLMEHILLLLVVPRWLLRLLPSEKTRLAADANDDFRKYVQEMMDEKIEDARQGEHVEGMDLLGQLVRSSHGSMDSDTKSLQTPALSHSDIMGNAFIMLVAGHETTANALHFTILELAMHPASQRRLQKDIDELVGDRDPKDWDYEGLINPMLASMLGACMNETLRLLPPVVEIPKKVTPSQEQVLTLDGEKHVMPKGALISVVAVSAHRNPRYWPSRPSKVCPGESDINDFVPERWFSAGEIGKKPADDGESPSETEDFGGYQGPDTSAQLFRPQRGAYVPFSDGARSCLGRRIAQVEIIAALAVLFRSYSLELAVDEWASDDAVERMSREEKAAVYQKAQEKSRRIIRGARSVITLKLNGGEHVPVRFARRGKERFVSWMQ